MNNIDNSNEQLFEQDAKWRCERNAAEDKYVACVKPATHVIEWRCFGHSTFIVFLDGELRRELAFS